MSVKTPLILSIETATRAGSVSVARGACVLSSIHGEPDTSHSADLLDNVRRALEAGGVGLSEIDLFGVALGPGSFTGLRIGIATVKSFAVSLRRMCVGVPTLHAVAHAAGPADRIVALLPGGRGGVFAQLFSVDSENRVEPLDEAAHLSPERMLKRYGSIPNLKWAEEGDLVHEALTNQGWTLARPNHDLAVSVAVLAFAEYLRGNAVGPEQLKAIYVRPSDAEIKASV